LDATTVRGSGANENSHPNVNDNRRKPNVAKTVAVPFSRSRRGAGTKSVLETLFLPGRNEYNNPDIGIPVAAPVPRSATTVAAFDINPDIVVPVAVLVPYGASLAALLPAIYLPTAVPFPHSDVAAAAEVPAVVSGTVAAASATPPSDISGRAYWVVDASAVDDDVELGELTGDDPVAAQLLAFVSNMIAAEPATPSSDVRGRAHGAVDDSVDYVSVFDDSVDDVSVLENDVSVVHDDAERGELAGDDPADPASTPRPLTVERFCAPAAVAAAFDAVARPGCTASVP